LYVQLAELAWPAVAKLSKDTPIVIPVAAIEQHGHHLPVFTDSLLLGEVVRRANEKLKERVLFTPLQWFGNSHHHIDFPGTMSASPRVYLDMLVDMAENFLHNGFRRIMFLNGHGGNTGPGRQATFELRQKYRQRNDLLLLFATYWGLGKKPAHEVESGFDQTELGHACEYETSMVMRLAPQQVVGDVTKIKPVPMEIPFGPAYRGWTTNDRTEIGHMGDPRTATPEKGETLFRIYAADVVAFLERVANWNGDFWSA
jgi:creatinine amidohydrolase